MEISEYKKDSKTNEKSGVVPRPKMMVDDFKPGTNTALNSEHDLKLEDID